ncbi:penicillin acylase family protein [Streptomyces sp. CAU 1734]|uniref:penicillin acylase family protein n=1 Tax=Streptomyces sp. CAU 1734 TaxID=3140360 RepID=UPI0032601E20
MSPATSNRPRRAGRTRRLSIAAVALVSAAVTLQPTASAVGSPAGEKTVSPHSGSLSASIRYTEYGIPHITAGNYTGLGFGSGWAQAADQVCVLANGFLTLRGERSLHFGPRARPASGYTEARTNLSSDLWFRGLRDAGTVRKLLTAPPPVGPGKNTRDMLRGWARGYNAWLAQNEIKDPACRGKSWVTPVTAEDLAVLGHALNVTAGHGLAAEALSSARPPSGAGAGKPPKPPKPARADLAQAAREARAAHGRVMPGLGSNAVALHGSTTANGRGLLLGNPHYPWQGGRRFWQSQQTIPGELNVAGASVLGSPVINIGHTDKVAWSHTVSTGVTVSLHELKLDPADPTAYLIDGRRERMAKRTVTVPVGDGETVTRHQWWTRYGPVVTSLPYLGRTPLPWTTTSAYALNDPNAAHLGIWDSALALAGSRTTGEMRAGLGRVQGLPWLNTIAADSRGGSLFTQSQVVPRITDELAEKCSTALGRATYPAGGLAVLDGSRTGCALGRDRDAARPGIFGPARMPTLRNAPYTVNSNDSAWLAHPDRPVTGYERVFGDTATARSLRTRGGTEDLSALTERGGVRLKDIERHQFANRAPAGDMAAADVARACAALPGGTAAASDGTRIDVSAACPVLRAWDRKMNTGSRGALLFDRFWERLTDRVPEDELWRTPFSASDPVRTPHTLDTGRPAVATALADAVQELRAMGVAPDAKWGSHHFVERTGSRIPLPGGSHTLGVWNFIASEWDPAAGGYHDAVHGSSYIQAVTWDGSGCPVARTLLTYGQSSDPGSPHSSDQTRLFSREKWVTPRFCEAEINASPELRRVVVREHR